jgi:tetratricopeptide (TPR) repeat protein
MLGPREAVELVEMSAHDRAEAAARQFPTLHSYEDRFEFVRLRSRDPEGAEAAARRVVVSESTDDPLRRAILLAQAYDSMDVSGDDKRAWDALQELASDPGLDTCGGHFLAAFHYAVGIVELRAGNQSEAARQFGEALRFAEAATDWPVWAGSIYHYGVALAHEQRANEAVAAFERLVAKSEDVTDLDLLLQTYLRLATLYIQQRKIWLASGAAGSAIALVRMNPSDSESTQAILMDLSNTVADQKQAIMQLATHVAELENVLALPSTEVTLEPPGE